MNFIKILQSVQGYMELGMHRDAMQELDALPGPYQDRPEVVGAKLTLQMKDKQWEAAVRTGQRLCTIAPDSFHAFLHTAFCLHEMGRTGEARDLLLKAPDNLKEEAVYHYNLACYLAVLGATTEAMARLAKSIELDPEFLEIAKNDPDLASIHDSLS